MARGCRGPSSPIRCPASPDSSRCNAATACCPRRARVSPCAMRQTMSSLSTPDSPDALGDARRATTFASHAAAVRRRERAAQWQLVFLTVVVLGPLVIYPLVRLLLLSLTGPHGGFGFQAYAAF